MDKDFQKLCQMWDKAVEDKVFGEMKKKPEEIRQDFFGQSTVTPSETINEEDTFYWKSVLQKFDPTMAKSKYEDFSKAVGPNPNPIQPASVGKDQDYEVVWTNNAQLEQLHDMKINLHELESKLNAGYALNTTQGKKVQDQIDGLKKKIDELSDSLSPDFLENFSKTKKSD